MDIVTVDGLSGGRSILSLG
jgi:5,10-methylenetetrahydromethanopterin reductase